MNDRIETLEGRWILQILLCLNAHAHRFSELRAAIPRISANILTDRLRALERTGLIERHPVPPPAPGQIYSLGTAAAELEPILDALARWQAGSTTRRPPRGAGNDHSPTEMEHSR
ncbi:helix-turn-helix domain-containing protein [Sphingomonas sp. G-3-2-10]|uniref:winged helix-turn-helix transcriptional regulator n=1 Tax=Sphingomonas sp. G-3-2-10 TaxID=2728838 RepID=UPI00146D2027|nr:helix-turn-helix domain-containing protein [Sphingomonas sp. G-3-2-10]NML08046.1 helix-turn-helix transcriptional regulator [Sphingomonas sp. G-3-2-10]